MNELTEAVFRGNNEQVQALLRKGANVNTTDPTDPSAPTPLHLAAKYSRLGLIQILLNAGAKINAKNRYGYTPLHCAAIYNGSKTVETLLNAGANINATDLMDYTALHWAAYHNNNETVTTLLNAGADTDATNIYGDTPLHIAYKNDYKKVAKLIKDHLSLKKMLAFMCAIHPRTGAQSEARVLPLELFKDILTLFKQMDH